MKKRTADADGGRRTADGGRRTADGGRRMADGGWRMADGGWRMADGWWRIACITGALYELSEANVVFCAKCETRGGEKNKAPANSPLFWLFHSRLRPQIYIYTISTFTHHIIHIMGWVPVGTVSRTNGLRGAASGAFVCLRPSLLFTCSNVL